MNPDFPQELYYPSSDFNDFETDGVELRRSPIGSFYRKCPEGKEKYIGDRMQKEAKLIDEKTCTRGAVRQQMVLCSLMRNSIAPRPQ
ncbi:MAG: hypothetical protein ABIL62_18170 [Planctomycetota bacterium]